MARTVLVTGGAGFIGSTLVRRLVEGGDRVRILDDLSIGSLRYLDGAPVEHIEASLADATAVDRAVQGVAAVVHLAARAGIPDSITDPLATLDANVGQTVGLLDAARRAGVGRFVLASSNAATGDHAPPTSETDLPHPLSPYGASKLAGEAFCQAYAASYGMAACALRFSNAYGPNSLHKKSVVATWLRTALGGGAITIHGDGTQTRDFVHVDDLATAILAAIDAPPEVVAGEVFGVGTGRETSIGELATTLIGTLDRPVEIVHAPARSGDVQRNVSLVDKAAARLGYRARVELADGLARTARWYDRALTDPELRAIRPHATSGSE